MKIKELIKLYEKNEIEFTLFTDLIEVEDILFNETEIKELHNFYDNEFENFYNSN